MRLGVLTKELSNAGNWDEGSPHWRAQNQTAHTGLACFQALILKEFFAEGLTVFLIVVGLGVAWEVRGLLFSRTEHASKAIKSLVDVVFYTAGAAMPLIEGKLELSLLASALLVGVVAWSLVGSVDGH